MHVQFSTVKSNHYRASDIGMRIASETDIQASHADYEIQGY